MTKQPVRRAPQRRVVSRREYMRRRRKKRRRIFYGFFILFLLIIFILFAVLIRKISADPNVEPAPTGGNTSESSSAAVAQEPTGSSPALPGGSAQSQPEQAASTVPEGYELRQMSETEMHEGNLILINKSYAYTFPEISMTSMYDLMNEAYTVSGTDVMMRDVAAQPLFALLNDFYERTQLSTINILCGYRSKEESQWLFNASAEENGLEHAERYVMLPGYSEHHSALAVDLGLIIDEGSVDYTGTDEYAWINENCHKYGFIVRYPDEKKDITEIDYEPWHFRYLGVPNATAVVNEGLCLEEYIDFIKNYTADGEHYSVQTEDGSYEIYYAAGTQVPVPQNHSYEISGNNVDGFIVTVKL